MKQVEKKWEDIIYLEREPPDPGLLLHLDIAHLVKHQLLNSISSLWGFEHCQTWNISKAYIYWIKEFYNDSYLQIL